MQPLCSLCLCGEVLCPVVIRSRNGVEERSLTNALSLSCSASRWPCGFRLEDRAPQKRRISRQKLSTEPHSSISQPSPAKLEGCVTCHGQIEPMHKYGTTETLEKLKDGKDAVGLTCTGCHGGNPVPRKTSDDPKSIQQIKNEAHVRPKFPDEWKRDGKYTGANPERTNTLLARESWEFVRFVNPGDLRVAAQNLRRRRLS